MEVKIYFNRKFPMSLVNTEVDITKDLEYIGSLYVQNYNDHYISDIDTAFQYVFNKCQLNDENLEIKLSRSLSVGDVLSYKLSGETTNFYLVDHVGFTAL